MKRPARVRRDGENWRVAKRLAAERYVLERDVPAMIEAAGKHWDWRMTGATSSAPQDK